MMDVVVLCTVISILPSASAVGAGAGNAGGLIIAGTAKDSPPPSGVIIGISIGIVVVVMGGMFAGRYWLCQQWIRSIEKARHDVLQQAAAAKGSTRLPLAVSSGGAASFEASFTCTNDSLFHKSNDHNHNNKDTGTNSSPLSTTTGNLEFFSFSSTTTTTTTNHTYPYNDLLSDNPSLAHCHTIVGFMVEKSRSSNNGDEDEFLITEGLVAPSGHFFWVQESKRARARILQLPLQRLVQGTLLAGTSSNGDGGGGDGPPPVVWQANNFTRGEFLTFSIGGNITKHKSIQNKKG